MDVVTILIEDASKVYFFAFLEGILYRGIVLKEQINIKSDLIKSTILSGIRYLYSLIDLGYEKR